MYRVRGTNSTAFIARFRCNVGTCSVNANGRVVRVCSVNSDVSTGSELRGIVSCEMLVGRVWVRPEIEKIIPFWVIYHRIIWMSREIERDTRVAQICPSATAAKRLPSSIRDARTNYTNQEPSQKELTSFMSNQIPEN